MGARRYGDFTNRRIKWRVTAVSRIQIASAATQKPAAPVPLSVCCIYSLNAQIDHVIEERKKSWWRRLEAFFPSMNAPRSATATAAGR